MNSRQLILFFILFSFVTASAQIMNVKKWRKSERDSLDYALALYEENGYLHALPIFEEILNHHPKEDFLKYSYGKCALYRQDKQQDAWQFLSEIYGKNKKVPDIQFDMALAAHYSYKFEEALQFVTQYAVSRRTDAEGKKNAAILKQYIMSAMHYYSMPTAAKVNNLGKTVNSSGDETGPVIAADGSALFFNYTGPNSVGGKQKLLVLKKLYLCHSLL